MQKIQFNEEKHEYVVDGKVRPSVTTILGYITQKGYSSINQSILERARMRGSAVHEMLEDIDYGFFPEEVDMEIFPYIKGYNEFLRDYSPSWDVIEYPVYDSKYGFCGTVDRAGQIDGRNTVIDLKTSNPSREAYMAVCCQTAAYAHAMEWDDARRYALFLKDGTYRLFDCAKWERENGFDGWQMFLSCLSLYLRIEDVLKPKKKVDSSVLHTKNDMEDDGR